MIARFRDFYWKHKLRSYHCKIAQGLSSIPKNAYLDMEANVRIGRVALDGGNYSIGAFTYIRSGSELNGNCNIGRFCSIGQNVIIGLDKKMHPIDWLTTSLFTNELDRKHKRELLNTKIDNDCWIGRDAIIMAGVSVGNGAIIGARALVTRDVPPYAIMAGVPAKIIKYRFTEDLIEKLQASEWWKINVDYLLKLNLTTPHECIKLLSAGEKAIYPKFRVTRKGAYLMPFED